jgi:MOSC domain-containing protein YiiM
MDILHIYLSPAHNYFGHHGKPPGQEPMIEVPAVECVAGSGLRGDRFFDFKPDYKGQVTFFEFETYERVCAALGVYGKEPHVFRRNIITRGVDLNTLIGCEFEVQGIRFLGTQEAAPCHWMEQAFGEGAESALAGHGGLRAKILTTGTLRSTADVATSACF